MANGDRADGEPLTNIEFVEIYREGFRGTPDAVGVSAEDGRILDINHSWERTSGYQRSDVVGKTALELGLWANPDEYRSIREALMRVGAVTQRVQLRRREGEVRDVFVAGSLVDVAGRSFIFWIGRDVTGQVLSPVEADRLREELRALTTDRRRLVSALIRAGEHERQRMSDELRLGPIQQLTASQLSLAVARPGLDADQRQSLDRVEVAIARVIGELRRMSVELQPAILEREGLGPAVRMLLRDLEESDGLAFDLDDRVGGDAPSADSSAVAYRAISEMLSSVRDSGGGRRVALTLESGDTDLIVTIRLEGPPADRIEPSDGRALDAGTAGDLLTTIGGSLEIHTSKDETIVTLHVPKQLA
jgi:PAS domain S-box-containing protein